MLRLGRVLRLVRLIRVIPALKSMVYLRLGDVIICMKVGRLRRQDIIRHHSFSIDEHSSILNLYGVNFYCLLNQNTQ